MFVDCRLPKGAGTTVAWQIRYRLTSEYPTPGQTTTALFPSGHQTFLLYLHVVFLRWSVRDVNLMCHTLVGVWQNKQAGNPQTCSGRSGFWLVSAADSPLSLFLPQQLTYNKGIFIHKVLNNIPQITWHNPLLVTSPTTPTPGATSTCQGQGLTYLKLAYPSLCVPLELPASKYKIMYFCSLFQT